MIYSLARKTYTYLRYKPSKEVKRLFRKFPDYQENQGGQKILFCPFAPHQINIIREGLMAHACHIRGANIKMISYDLYFKAIDFLNFRVKKDLKTSYAVTKKLYKTLKLPVILLSKYYKESDNHNTSDLSVEQIQNLTVNGIYVGDLVIASTVHYYMCNEPEWDNPVFMNMAREFARTAIALVNIYERLLKEEKPDKIVTTHGIYVSWGTLFRVARKLEIPIDVYGASYRRDTLRFYHNTPTAPIPPALWPKYKDVPLTETENKIVEQYFKSRETQKEDNISLFPENTVFPKELQDFISEAKEKGQKLFALFTNISWDAFMFGSEKQIFSSMVDWLNETIKFFEQTPNAKLIIKAHPAELYFKVPEKYQIKSLLPKNLADNIYFIDNKDAVKPFDLYNYIDFGLTYISTVTLEMAMRQIPVITAGDISHYSGKGFSVDPESREEYMELLTKAVQGKLNFTPDIETAKRYMYYKFFREAIPFNLVTTHKYKVQKINILDYSDLEDGKNKPLDIICNGILNNADYIYPYSNEQQ